ncbi:MAG: Grx4 family monothiol glutaredoxin [Sphingomonadaceae bacterium]
MDTRKRIEDLVSANKVVLFMKGTKFFPQCGFSSRAVAILEHLGAEFHDVDVLQDPEIRQGIKEFSDWPTIPQLYVNGEFVGGSDIMMEMFEDGELQALLSGTPAGSNG